MIVKYNPLKSLFDFNQSLFPYWSDMDTTWGGAGNASFELKTKETDKEYLIRAEAVGFEKDEVTVEISDGIISIRGEKKEKSDEWDFSGAFSRTYSLPDNIIVDQIEGELKNGILLITIPKKEKYVKKIEIK